MTRRYDLAVLGAGTAGIVASTYAEGPARAAESWFWRSYLTQRNRRALRPLLATLRALDHPRGG